MNASDVSRSGEPIGLCTRRKRSGWSVLLRAMKAHPWIYVMLLPGVLYFLIFSYLPMFGVVIAFQRFNPYQGILQSRWVGFANFLRFFESVFFWRLIRNTLLLNAYGLLVGFPAPIILALMLNEVRRGWFKRIAQTFTYLPYFISTVVVATIIMAILAPVEQGGLANTLLTALGRPSIDFMNRPEWFRHIYIWSDAWQFTGWNSIIYLAALAAVDPALYESAEIDGAGRFAKMWHISLPSILPVIMILLLLSIGYMLSVGFEKVFMLYNASTYETADVIATYVYRAGLLGSDYGFGAAVGLFSSVVNLIMIVVFNSIARGLKQQTLW
ncbi:MAG: sugar ABC transporter permease [Chloroflexi bacterium]|nr:sugar ABC transporter permease [Chloroflexota bacterium]